jgi:DNA (cytosine-5)-methyltransferase 1
MKTNHRNDLCTSATTRSHRGGFKHAGGQRSRTHAARRNGRRNTAPTFIDLFSGVGGFRLGMERAGAACVLSVERDPHCRRTYLAWFPQTAPDFPSDIRDLNAASLPKHDILCAGWPCPPFSVAGVSKRNSLGRAHGFRDPEQGDLFFRVADAIAAKRPKAFILENVPHLLAHDEGRTWRRVADTLTGLRYTVCRRVIDASAFVPQRRERLFIVGFDAKRYGREPRFRWPILTGDSAPTMRDILIDAGEHPDEIERCTLDDRLWHCLLEHRNKHKASGNGFGYGIVGPRGVARTLTARYCKDGGEILIDRGAGRNPRTLAPREAARLMGFPDGFAVDVVSRTQMYRLLGNAVVPQVVEAIGRAVIRTINRK